MTKPTVAALVVLCLPGCEGKQAAPSEASAPSAAAPVASAATRDNLPPLDPKNIISIAVGSTDHTTLVAALKAADYVTSVANPGPLTVFAPTNDAFAKLPKGTVESLVTPEKKADLQEILKYHVTTSVYETKFLQDGQTLSMANGAKTTVHVKDGKVTVNDANVIASIRASNGIIHVIDTVLLPPAK